MLTIHDGGSRLCDVLTRRDWLRVGGLIAKVLHVSPSELLYNIS